VRPSLGVLLFFIVGFLIIFIVVTIVVVAIPSPRVFHNR
jgi:hypothetical protein